MMSVDPSDVTQKYDNEPSKGVIRAGWIRPLRYGPVDWNVNVVRWQPGRECLISKLYLVGWQIDKTMSQEVSEGRK